MKKQKDFVVEQVKIILGASFEPYKTIALGVLTKNMLELLKDRTFHAILNKDVEYGNTNSSLAEVRTYARSMVMNHLKKARELNGNLVYGTSEGKTVATKAVTLAPKGVDVSVLPETLKEYVKTLV